MMIQTNKFRHLFRQVTLGLVACGLTLSALVLYAPKVSADACSINGRNCYYGYFTNAYDGGPGVTRHNVLADPGLLNVHNVDQFVSQIRAYLGGCSNLNTQNQTGAAFIVLTMLDYPPGTGKSVACTQFARWERTVRNLSANGFINYDRMHPFGGINTRSTYTDVMWYPDNNPDRTLSIVVTDPDSGGVRYAIKKDCGNPIGRNWGLRLDIRIVPLITCYVGTLPCSDGVETGDQVTFRYYLSNTGRTDSGSTNCYGGKLPHTGYFPTPSTPESGGTPLILSCPRNVDPGGANYQVGGPEPLTAPANTTICRTLFATPQTESGGTAGTEYCTRVVSKPYLKVSGGDVAVGGDLESEPDVCSNNPTAAVSSWNKRDTGLYSGAGTQYAAFALSRLYEFATAQGSPSGGAAPGVGLSFANLSTNPGAGNFGGNFGTAPITCIKDYYGQKPADAAALPGGSFSSVPSGSYTAAGNVTLDGGELQPDKRIRLFVDGDLYITSNLTYDGSWDYARIPLLQVVVRGNIYISNNVSQLDGTFIAQPIGTTKGYIYTCASGFAQPSVTSNFYTNCSNKLTVNGALVSRTTEFLRNSGTLKQSTSSEDSADLVNYGPAFWITQPDVNANTGGDVDNYDSITSLPPVL